jgi:hypothetical protein
MENSPENRLLQERNFFLSRVKNPVFMLQHLPSLAAVILQRYQTKILTKLRGPFRSNKKNPPWLRSLTASKQSRCREMSDFVARIPQFELTASEFKVVDQPWQSANTDPETAFAEQRWGILIDDLLTCQWSLPVSVNQQIDTSVAQGLSLETYSTCERLANLLLWLAYMPQEQRLSALPANTLVFVELAMQWVLAHLEFYGKRTGNHILNNARSLILAGIVLDNALAVQTGIRILKKMLPILIQANGFLRERSSHYQLIVLGWLLDASAFLQASAYVPAVELEFLADCVLRMQQAAASLCDEKGDLQAFIGDISPDMGPAKTSQRLRQCYKNQWPASALNPGIHDDWCILENLVNKLILNCPAGKFPKEFSSHGHNDISSFVWLHHGVPILIDTGRATYMKQAQAIKQKSAFGHNVAMVNGFAPLAESLVLNGNWWPTPYASATVSIQQADAATVTMNHDGFSRGTPVKQHRRTVLLKAAGLQVIDEFVGVGSCEIEFFWQLAADFIIQPDGSTGNQKFILEMEINQMPVHYQAKTSECSNQYGITQPHTVIYTKRSVELPAILITVFKVQPCVE